MKKHSLSLINEKIGDLEPAINYTHSLKDFNQSENVENLQKGNFELETSIRMKKSMRLTKRESRESILKEN